MTKLHSKNHSVIWDEKSEESLWDAVQKLNGVFDRVETDAFPLVLEILQATLIPHQSDGNKWDTTYGTLIIESV